MKTRLATALIAALVCGCASESTRVTPQTPSPSPIIELNDGMVLRDADVAAVLEIGCKLGVQHVDRIVAGQVTQPNGPLGVRLIRTVMIEPTVLRRSILIVNKADQPWVAQTEGLVSVGAWASCSQWLREFKLRRMSVGNEQVDISLQEGVSYEVASSLVAAILNGDVEPPVEMSSDEKIMSVSRVQSFLMPAGHEESGKHDLYQVGTGVGIGGRALILCLEGSDIVLVDTRHWIV